jgi:hypothetical protein
MSNTIVTLLLLGFLLILLIYPAAALAPLVVVIFVSIIGLIGWTMLRAIAQGGSKTSDRLTHDP